MGSKWWYLTTILEYYHIFDNDIWNACFSPCTCFNFLWLDSTKASCIDTHGCKSSTHMLCWHFLFFLDIHLHIPTIKEKGMNFSIFHYTWCCIISVIKGNAQKNGNYITQKMYLRWLHITVSKKEITKFLDFRTVFWIFATSCSIYFIACRRYRQLGG